MGLCCPDWFWTQDPPVSASHVASMFHYSRQILMCVCQVQFRYSANKHVCFTSGMTRPIENSLLNYKNILFHLVDDYSAVPLSFPSLKLWKPFWKVENNTAWKHTEGQLEKMGDRKDLKSCGPQIKSVNFKPMCIFLCYEQIEKLIFRGLNCYMCILLKKIPCLHKIPCLTYLPSKESGCHIYW